MLIGVVVRWRVYNVRPQEGGYDLWDGTAWLPISHVEYQSYVRRGLSVHVNPPWSGR
jgi:hypothetical protein